jgi:biopolymer transport protein ExbD
MLQSKHHHDEPLFINLTPMIDVILTLLVFFMTATKLYDWDEQKLDVSVPQVSAARPLTQAPDDLALTIDESGGVSLRGESVALAELRRRLKEARDNYADQGVLIRADGRATHQMVADVMSACHAAGIGHIVFSVREIATP